MRRYPSSAIAPLLGSVTARTIAATLGVDMRTAVRWRNENVGITEEQADVLATLVGVNPACVWPDWHVDLERACERCGETYVPVINSPRLKYCSRKCQQKACDDSPERRAYMAEWQRRKYQENEAAREAKKKASRTYWQTAGKRARARKKAA